MADAEIARLVGLRYSNRAIANVFECTEGAIKTRLSFIGIRRRGPSDVMKGARRSAAA